MTVCQLQKIGQHIAIKKEELLLVLKELSNVSNYKVSKELVFQVVMVDKYAKNMSDDNLLNSCEEYCKVPPL